MPANETTHSSLLFDDGPDTCPPHSAYINQLLIDRNYTPIFHMLEDYFDDQDAITHEELLRRIMLVNEPPQGMENMINVCDDLPPKERAESELQTQIGGFLALGNMGFRVWLGIGVDEDSMTEGTAANKFKRALYPVLRGLAGRPGTGDGRRRRMVRRRMGRGSSRDEPHTNEAPEAPSATSGAVDEKKEEAPTDSADK